MDKKTPVDIGQSDSESNNNHHEPSPLDVSLVRRLITRVAKSRIPPSIITVILDLAEYWAHSEASVSIGHGLLTEEVACGGGRVAEDVFILRTYPIGMVDSCGCNFHVHHYCTDTWRFGKDAASPTVPSDSFLPVMEHRRRMREDPDFAQLMAHRRQEALAAQEAQRTDTSSSAVPPALSAPYAEYENLPTLDPKTLSDIVHYTIPFGQHPVRKVVFRLRCKDQGFAVPPEHPNKPYEDSHTWFEAGLERFQQFADTEEQRPIPVVDERNLRCIIPVSEVENGIQKPQFRLEPDEKMLIQKNKRAEQDWQDYEVVWRATDSTDKNFTNAFALELMGRGKESASGDFVRSLAVGDVVTLWAKARFGSWKNHLQQASLCIYWAL